MKKKRRSKAGLPVKNKRLRLRARPGPASKKLKELMVVLRVKLRDPRYFRGLEKIRDQHWVRKFSFNGLTVAVKRTEGKISQGADYRALRRAFLSHQQAVRGGKINPKYYILRSIKVHGHIGDYLIMRYIPPYKDRNITSDRSFNVACSEVGANFNKLRCIPPQTTMHVMPLRNTKPHSPSEGKWIIYLPYDYC